MSVGSESDTRSPRPGCWPSLLSVGVLGLMALLLFMLHVHAGDVAYIAHTHRPIVVVPTGSPAGGVELRGVELRGATF